MEYDLDQRKWAADEVDYHVCSVAKKCKDTGKPIMHSLCTYVHTTYSYQDHLVI